ncbi:hypothetical protein HPB47_014231 [Ixodes persulcatus]|uniref:Uncharacterized protein n=1 Tax=Ixodes persulcatus TaxID=34615 RepID=A0AC60QZ01_IXOPE|nr:hypothetical protein HPB47_014231 [Ixodes persulcatus]
MPEEILPTPTGRSVCSDDRGTLSTSQMRLEGHWNLDVVNRKRRVPPPPVRARALKPLIRRLLITDQLDGGLADSSCEMEETLPASTGEGFCPEDYNKMSLSLLDLEGHCSGARVVKKEPEERLSSPARDSSEDPGETSPSKRRPKKRRSNARAGKKGPRRARRVRGSYTILKKVNVVEWHRQNGNNVSKTARQFDIDRKRIRDWNANYQSLLQECQGENRVRRSMGKGRPVFSKEIDKALVSFLEDERLAGRPVSNLLLQAHARQLAAKMGLGGFQASHQYLTRWKRRFNVSLRTRTNENQKRPAN